MALTGDGRSEQEAEQSSVAAAAAIRSVLIFLSQCYLEEGGGAVLGEAGPVEDIVLDILGHDAVCLSAVAEEESLILPVFHVFRGVDAVNGVFARARVDGFVEDAHPLFVVEFSEIPVSADVLNAREKVL